MYIAKKHLGQNFLKEKIYIDKIIESIPKKRYQLVEIGIGLGDLTRELIKLDSVVAYEVDSDLCSLFSKNFSSSLKNGSITLINKSILDMPNKQNWLFNGDYTLVSNLPYYAATHIILRLLRDNSCKSFVVMTQKEVAEKFCADTNMREFCALSVLIQTFGKAKLLFNVPNTAFEPAPKVESSVFCVEKIQSHLNDNEIESFETFLKIAFAQPRKKLSKNLKTAFSNAESILANLSICDNARPNEVGTKSYHQIYQLLRSFNGKDTKHK